jgi:hypothetical protein
MQNDINGILDITDQIAWDEVRDLQYYVDIHGTEEEQDRRQYMIHCIEDNSVFYVRTLDRAVQFRGIVPAVSTRRHWHFFHLPIKSIFCVVSSLSGATASPYPAAPDTLIDLRKPWRHAARSNASERGYCAGI